MDQRLSSRRALLRRLIYHFDLYRATVRKLDTGVFAYGIIRRGERFGLRIVGSLKSQPALNVLAIYEK